MSPWTTRFRQAFYPPQFRILPDGQASSLARAVADMAACLESLLARIPASPGNTVEPATDSAGPSAPTAPDKKFVIELCNQVHRLGRAVKKAQEQGSADASRFQRPMDSLVAILRENAIEWEDLSGQAYSPDRADFEPLGEPQPVPGLTRDTILQCERPAVIMAGRIIQRAKGTVGQPPG